MKVSPDGCEPPPRPDPKWGHEGRYNPIKGFLSGAAGLVVSAVTPIFYTAAGALGGAAELREKTKITAAVIPGFLAGALVGLASGLFCGTELFFNSLWQMTVGAVRGQSTDRAGQEASRMYNHVFGSAAKKEPFWLDRPFQETASNVARASSFFFAQPSKPSISAALETMLQKEKDSKTSVVETSSLPQSIQEGLKKIRDILSSKQAPQNDQILEMCIGSLKQDRFSLNEVKLWTLFSLVYDLKLLEIALGIEKEQLGYDNKNVKTLSLDELQIKATTLALEHFIAEFVLQSIERGSFNEADIEFEFQRDIILSGLADLSSPARSELEKKMKEKNENSSPRILIP